MKKLLQITLAMVALGATLTFQSCDKVKSEAAAAAGIPPADFTAANVDIIIPPTADTTQQAMLDSVVIPYNIDSMIKAESGGLASFSTVKTIYIKSIKLTLEDARDASNFANFSNITTVFNSDARNPGDNNNYYTPYTIAQIDNNPDNFSNVISPAVVSTTDDVKKYFTPNMTFYYYLKAKLRRPVKDSLHCHVEATYTIGF